MVLDPACAALASPDAVALSEKRGTIFGDGYGHRRRRLSQERVQSALDGPRIHQTVEIAWSELSNLMLATRATSDTPSSQTSVSSSPNPTGGDCSAEDLQREFSINRAGGAPP